MHALVPKRVKYNWIDLGVKKVIIVLSFTKIRIWNYY